MPTPTYDLIASNVLTSSASSVTFSSIPATYRDLVLVMTVSSSGGGSAQIRLNSDSGNNYSWVYMVGTGSSASSASSSDSGLLTSYIRNYTNQHIFQFQDYSATDKHKAVLSRSGGASNDVWALAQRWANTSAVNSIAISILSNTFDSGSTFYLYGIVS